MADYIKEQQEIERFVANWEVKLSQTYKNLWFQWKKNRDIVAKEMKLSSYDVACVTKYELVRYVSQNIKAAMGLNDQTAYKITHTRGNTHIFNFLNTLTNDRVEYRKKCSRFLDSFEKRIEKLKNKR